MRERQEVLRWQWVLASTKKHGERKGDEEAFLLALVAGCAKHTGVADDDSSLSFSLSYSHTHTLSLSLFLSISKFLKLNVKRVNGRDRENFLL